MKRKANKWGIKPWQFSCGRTASDSGRKLAIVNRTIEEIENSNFIVRFFNKKSLTVLKQQKSYIERQIEKEKNLVKEIHLLKGAHDEVDNIVKENKKLSKEIKKWKEVRYVSKKAVFKKRNEIKDNLSAIVNIRKAPKHRGRPKWKPRWPRKIG